MSRQLAKDVNDAEEAELERNYSGSCHSMVLARMIFASLSAVAALSSRLPAVGSRYAISDVVTCGPWHSPATWARAARNQWTLLRHPCSEAGFAWQAARADASIVFSEQGAFGNIVISAHGPWHCLMLDDGSTGEWSHGNEQGLAYLEGRKRAPDVIGFEYLRVMAAAAMAFSELAPRTAPKRMLCVGLGTGALPGWLAHHFPWVSVSAVEIDPVVIRAAHSVLCANFTLVSKKGAGMSAASEELGTAAYLVHEADAAEHVAKIAALDGGGVSAILLDAYDAVGAIPAHLMRPAFVRDCREALTAGGVLVINVFNGCEGSDARAAVNGLASVLSEGVGEVYSLVVPDHEQSLVLVARRNDADGHGEAKGAERPGRRDVRAAVQAAWGGVGLPRREGARLVRRLLWMEATGEERAPPALGSTLRGILQRRGGRRRTSVDSLRPASSACPSWMEDG